MSLRLRSFLLLVSATVTAIFFINFCDLVYQCGCRSLWNGADAHCNVHDPETRDCPFCQHPPWGGVVPLGVILGGQAGVCLSRKERYGRSVSRRLAISIMMFPVVGGVVALGFGVATGYWS